VWGGCVSRKIVVRRRTPFPPKIVALRDDPEISDMIAQGRFLDLLQDQRIIDAANVYEVILAYELKTRGLIVERQKPMPIMYDDIRFDEAFRSDMVVNGKVIAQLKSVEALLRVHAKQVLTQLRLSGLKLGLLINFGEAHLKKGIQRIINGKLDDETSSEVSL
jgi:GxxExxY protein